jgi:GT2 family glycosyltransferase
MIKIGISIVLYHNSYKEINDVINCILNSKVDTRLFLVDNSKTDNLKALKRIHSSIEYMHNKKNLGYGAAHNIAIKKSMNSDCKYHLILNPDIIFSNNVLNDILKFMEEHHEVGNLMPLVEYDDGSIQYLCKLLPSPLELIFRRFIPSKYIKQKINYRYELQGFNYKEIANIPSLSGCFMFIRLSILRKVGFFDENFFMYFEDLDLNRRINSVSKTIFYPKVKITHKFKKESYKVNRLLLYHIMSAIYYFNKWGWFIDKNKKQINNRTLKKLNL